MCHDRHHESTGTESFRLSLRLKAEWMMMNDSSAAWMEMMEEYLHTNTQTFILASL